VVFIEGDNGASGEGSPSGSINEMRDLSSGEHGIPLDYLADNLDVLGGPDTYEGFQLGWTLAMDTPFPWFKQVASHLGGVRNGMVISWPARIKQQGEVRSQYHHVIDVMPTLLDAARIAAPDTVDGFKQQPIDGTSMVYSFDNAEAPSTRTTQYYEIHGNRGIYHDGWLANTTPRNMPWNMPMQPATDTSTYEWELYNLGEDFSQSHDLAATNPEKLKELQALFDQQARKYNVYPLQDEGGMLRGMKMVLNSGALPRSSYVYWGAGVQLQVGVAPPMFQLPFSIEADVDVPAAGGAGVIMAAGSKFGGWSFYLRDGKPVGYASSSGLPLPGAQSRVAADQPLAPGKHLVKYEFSPKGKDGGDLGIYVDGAKVASGPITLRPKMMAGNGETLDTGRDTNVPVSPDYQGEGVFNGQIHKVEVTVKIPSLGQPAPAAKGAKAQPE